MAEKKKTLTVKKPVKKEKVEKVEKEVEVAQPKVEQPKEVEKKEPEIKEPEMAKDVVSRDGVTVERNADKILITFPNRKDINYAFNDTAIGLKNSLVGWDKAPVESRLFEKENIQSKTVSYNVADMTATTHANVVNAIERARTINKEHIQERDSALEYFKTRTSDTILVYGVPTRAQDKMVDGHATGAKEFVPSYFNGEIVKAGKHLVAAIEGSKDGKTYVRLLETSRLQFDAQDYGDKAMAAKRHLGIKPENLEKTLVNGTEQEVVKNVVRHMSFNSEWQVAKIRDYIPKQEQAPQVKAEPKKKTPTLKN